MRSIHPSLIKALISDFPAVAGYEYCACKLAALLFWKNFLLRVHGNCKWVFCLYSLGQRNRCSFFFRAAQKHRKNPCVPFALSLREMQRNLAPSQDWFTRIVWFYNNPLICEVIMNIYSLKVFTVIAAFTLSSSVLAAGACCIGAVCCGGNLPCCL